MELLRILGCLIISVELVYFILWGGCRSIFLLVCLCEKSVSLLIKVFPSEKVLGKLSKKMKRIVNALSNDSASSGNDKRNNSWETGKILNFTHYRKRMKRFSSQYNVII